VVVSVIEPVLLLSITRDVSVVDAADAVRFTVTVRHAANSTSTAYGTRLVLDSLVSNKLNLVAGSVVFSGTSIGGSVLTGNGVGDDSIVAVLPLYAVDGVGSGDVTLVFDAIVANTVTIADRLNGAVQLTYTSSPFNVDGNVGGSVTLNAVTSVTSRLMYSISTISVRNISVPLESLQFPTVSIGEVVELKVRLTFGEGTSRRSNFTFSLPSYNGQVGTGTLAVLNSRVEDIGSSLSFASAGAASSVGAAGIHSNIKTVADGLIDTVVFDFGTVVNAGDNVMTGGDEIVVSVTALAANVASNRAGVWLNSTGSFNFGTGSTLVTSGGSTYSPLVASASLQLVDAYLNVSISSNVASVNSGDDVIYTIVISHLAS